MSELTIVIDNWSHNELEEYLKALQGIKDVKIKNEDMLEIYVKFDNNLISNKMIKNEILLFLDILKIPSIIAFNKHPSIKTCNYKIKKENFCCEYCFKGAIGSLFDINGIEKVTTNYTENFYEENNIIIDIDYNPKILNLENIKQIELNVIDD